MTLRAKHHGKLRIVSKAMARRLLAHGVRVIDDAVRDLADVNDSLPVESDEVTDLMVDVVSERERAAVETVKASGEWDTVSVLPGGEIVSDEALKERMLTEKTCGIAFDGSSNVRSARLSEATGIVTVQFKNGATAQYANFTRDLMTEWEAAQSPGSWLHKNVKSKPDRHPIVGVVARPSTE